MRMYLNRRISSTATAEAAGDRGSLSHLKDEMPWVTVLCESPACVCGRWMDGLSLPDGARPGTKCSTTLLTAWRGEMNGPLIMDLCTVWYRTVLYSERLYRLYGLLYWPVVYRRGWQLVVITRKLSQGGPQRPSVELQALST